MPEQPEHRPMPNAALRVLLEAIEEVMGPNGTKAVLNAGGLSQYIDNYPPKNLAMDASFAEYGRVTPSVFVFLGSTPDGVDPTTAPANHSPLFTMHEPHMEVGVKGFAHMVVDYLKAQ